MSTIRANDTTIVVESSAPYIKGREVGREVNHTNYQRLMQLQQLARENNYQDKDDYGQPSTEQILFILGVCQTFRLQAQKASANWLDLEVLEEGE